MKPFRVYADPGHAWIAVKEKLLIEFDIADKITPYSYFKGKTVYLEEDCDASTFVEAFVKKFGVEPVFAKENHVNWSHPIRKYRRYIYTGKA